MMPWRPEVWTVKIYAKNMPTAVPLCDFDKCLLGRKSKTTLPRTSVVGQAQIPQGTNLRFHQHRVLRTTNTDGVVAGGASWLNNNVSKVMGAKWLVVSSQMSLVDWSRLGLDAIMTCCTNVDGIINASCPCHSGSKAWVATKPLPLTVGQGSNHVDCTAGSNNACA